MWLSPQPMEARLAKSPDSVDRGRRAVEEDCIIPWQVLPIVLDERKSSSLSQVKLQCYMDMLGA